MTLKKVCFFYISVLCTQFRHIFPCFYWGKRHHHHCNSLNLSFWPTCSIPTKEISFQFIYRKASTMMIKSSTWPLARIWLNWKVMLVCHGNQVYLHTSWRKMLERPLSHEWYWSIKISTRVPLCKTCGPPPRSKGEFSSMWLEWRGHQSI